jgi:hypothetical protein
MLTCLSLEPTKIRPFRSTDLLNKSYKSTNAFIHNPVTSFDAQSLLETFPPSKDSNRLLMMQVQQGIVIDATSPLLKMHVSFTYSASHEVYVACDKAKRGSCVSHIGTLPTRVFDLLTEAKVVDLVSSTNGRS